MEISLVSTLTSSPAQNDREAKLEALRAMMLKKALQAQTELRSGKVSEDSCTAHAADTGKGLKLDLHV